jgi:preprotein translocase subunit Sss1
MYPSRIVKEEARKIAYQLTLEDILFIVEVLNAYLDIHELVKRALERYQRLTRTYTTPTSIQEELLRRIFLQKGEQEEEEEEEEILEPEEEEKLRQQARSKLMDIIQKARERATMKEIKKAEKDLQRAKELGLVDEEEEQKIRQYIESKKREIGMTEKPEEKEMEKEGEE